MKPIFGTLLLVLLAPLADAGQLVSLKDGTSYVGRVTEVTPTHVVVEAEFPIRATRRVAREELTDHTLWRILSARVGRDDGPEWLKLGLWAEERGLLVPALVGYRRASLDPQLSDEAGKRIAAVEARMAQNLFDRGERYFLEGRPASAQRYFEILGDRYPATPVAPIAKTRLEQIRRLLAEAKAAAKADAGKVRADEALRTARSQWDAEVAAIQEHLHRAVRARPDRLEPSRPVRTSRSLERVVDHLEAAWRRVKSLGHPPEGVAPDAAERLTQTVKSRLVRAYLDTGLAYLMRPSINQAEAYCTKACDLDPENAATHALHEKIIYARLNSGWWGIGFARRGRR